MNRDLKALYINVLKYNWRIDGYYKEPNGNIVIKVSPWRNYSYPFPFKLTPAA